MSPSIKQFDDTIVPDVFDTAEELAASRSPAPSKVARILLVEDDQELRRFLAERLRKSGFFVLEVQNGYGMEDFIRKDLASDAGINFDLVITDIRMPGTNGLQILSAFHSYDPKLPVILITAFGNPETHAEARLRGAVAVLDKPFSLSELLNLIRSVLRHDGRSGREETGHGAR